MVHMSPRPVVIYGVNKNIMTVEQVGKKKD